MQRDDTVRLVRPVGRWQTGQRAVVVDVAAYGVLLLVDRRFGSIDNRDDDVFVADTKDLEPAEPVQWPPDRRDSSR